MGNCHNQRPRTCWDEFTCLRPLAQGADRVEVASAFNGIGIYKISSLGPCKYNGTNSEPILLTADDCEHVAFHRCLRDNGKTVFISGQKLYLERDDAPKLEHSIMRKF